jgi:arginine-tRNA-protein transferase
MYSDSRSPSFINPAELDAYLANGWYRMHETIFTTHFLNHQDELRSAIWLRNRLDDFNTESYTFLKLEKRTKNFKSEFGPLYITEAHEVLFRNYRKHQFDDENDSLNRSLCGSSGEAPFDSYMLNLYDGRKLIACGIYDWGFNSVAGIVSFYDEAYSKYSLGKYLIYKKINYAKSRGMTYFYPGYFMPGVSRFDYKLSIGSECLEYLELSSSSWMPIEMYDHSKNPLVQLSNALESLKAKLKNLNIFCRIYRLSVFDIGLVIPGLEGTIDSPLYLWTEFKIFGKREVVVVYNIATQHFILYHTDPVEDGFYQSSDDNYDSCVAFLEFTPIGFSSGSVDILAAELKAMRD